MDLIFLPRNLSKLAEFCATEEGRYAMTTGVRVTLTPGRYRCDATNGKFVATVKGPSAPPPFKSDEDAIRSRAADLPQGAQQAILNAKDWKESLGWRESKGGIALCLSPNVASFLSRTKLATSTPIEGRFPDISQCVPRLHPGSVSFAIRPEYLLPIVNLSRALELEALEVIFYAPDLPVGFTGSNRQGQVLDVLLMPVALPAPVPVQTAS